MLFPWKHHRKKILVEDRRRVSRCKAYRRNEYEIYHRQEAGYSLDFLLQLQFVQALVRLQTVYSIPLTTPTVSAERQRIVPRNASRGAGYALNGLEIRERNDRSGFGIISVAPVNDTVQRANVREPGHLTRLFETPW